MKPQQKKHETHEELLIRLQKDVDSILDEFHDHLKHREDEDSIRVHFDVDFVISNIQNKKAKKHQEKLERVHAQNTANEEYSGSLYDNGQFFERVPMQKSRFFLRKFAR